MKLSPRDAPAYFARPDPDKTGLLIYGTDAMRVALKRQEVIAALIGPQGEEEMRLTRIQAGELRKDPAMLLDEPTASLDAQNRATVLSLIEAAKARGAAIIGIFHDETARAQVCDRFLDVAGFSPKAAA